MTGLSDSTLLKAAPVALALLVTACTQQPVQHQAPVKVVKVTPQDGPPQLQKDIAQIADAIPRAEPKARYGNHSPYKVFGKTYHVMGSSQNFTQEGMASWYGSKFAGRYTSSREIYDPWKMTAAHKSLPLPSYVRVTNLNNQRSVVVRVNDRGPFHGNRIIDLSYAAAKKLGYADQGTAKVRVEVIDVNNTANKLYLQAGAFTNQATALQLKQQLDQMLDTPTMLRHAMVNNKAFYRVFVGPFQNQVTALAVKDFIIESRLAKPMLVMR